MRINTALLKISESAGDILKNSEDPDLITAHRLLHLRLIDPQSFVTVVGETSSGKSTLINGFFEKELLPTSARPTTGTVTWLESRNIFSLEYSAINRDGTREELDENGFKQLAMNPDENLLRLHVRVPAPSIEFEGINLFDTPGFNSIVLEHEEVLREFIPQSDVVIFVVSHRVGFGEQDQELMKLVYELSQSDANIPVFLVVNRCLQEETHSSKRLKEIVSNASDSLHRPLKVHLVRSVLPENPDIKVPIYPNAHELWKEVNAIAKSEERSLVIDNKIKLCLNNLIQDMILECENSLSASNLMGKDIEELEREKESFNNALNLSCQIVDKYMDRLKRNIPQMISTQTDVLIATVIEEINNHGKWTEESSCKSYIAGHVIPFGIKDVCREITRYVRSTFEEMDQELSEMANKTIRQINDRASSLKSPDMAKLIGNIAARFALRLSGEGAKSIVRGFGGVGGIASGTGNLAKMAVKNFGKLLGKTFGKEVYAQIGRIFTKKLMARLNIVFTVLIETAGIIHHAYTWQDELRDKVKECLMEWREDILKEFNSESLPEYTISNKTLVNEIYSDSIKDIDKDIATAKNKISSSKKAELLGYIVQLKELKNKLEGLV